MNAFKICMYDFQVRPVRSTECTLSTTETPSCAVCPVSVPGMTNILQLLCSPLFLTCPVCGLSLKYLCWNCTWFNCCCCCQLNRPVDSARLVSFTGKRLVFHSCLTAVRWLGQKSLAEFIWKPYFGKTMANLQATRCMWSFKHGKSGHKSKWKRTANKCCCPRVVNV